MAGKKDWPRTLGIPYQGSKNRIAKWLIDLLPPAKHFYDVFAGGCAVSHAALASGKYEVVHINDINPLPTRLFMDALEGKYLDERRVITREDFAALKDTDPYVRYCWSFGNKGRDYLWSVDKEDDKLLVARMLMAEDVNERRLLWRNLVNRIKGWVNRGGGSRSTS